MDNPFQTINERLTNIEDLLLSIKHEKIKSKPIEPRETELLLDKRESARVLNCSVSTIDAMRRKGDLKPIYIGGRKGAVRFRKNDLLKFINK